MSLPTLVIVAPAMRSGGSVGSVAWHHALELSRTRKVCVITRDVPDHSHAAIEAILVRPRSWTWLRRFCHVPNELAFLVAARKALLDLSRRQTVDVVWCHSHASTALVAAPLKERLGFGLIMTTHGDIFDRPPGTYSRDLTWFYKAVTPRAYRRADVVHVLSPYMGDCAVRGGARPDRVRFVPNGVDPGDLGVAAAEPRQPATFMPDGAQRLLYVGSLWNVKGVDVLLHALAMLREGLAPTSGASLTVVGDGPARASLVELTGALGIANAVTFEGHVPRRDLPRFYAAADVLCIPSLSEALPTVAMEAMLFGLPMVGSDTGGIPVLVEDGATGYLAQPGDAPSLALCLRKATASRPHLADLGARGFAKVREHFTWPAISGQLHGLVLDAIAHGRASPAGMP